MTSSLLSSVPAETLLRDLLAVSQNGVNLLRPLYGPAGELHDFACEYLNPAAQRMTGLPESPGGTARTLFPAVFTNGLFNFYRQVYETGEAGEFELYYQADGLDNYFRVAARRTGERLLVSFTDTADQPRSPAEDALRQLQAREQQARVAAEAERERLYALLMEAPAVIAVFEGPDHVIRLANPSYQQLVGDRPLLGRPLGEAVPEVCSQPHLLGPLDEVYRTGQPYFGQELAVQLDRTNTGELATIYFNLVYQPTRDIHGRVAGVLAFAFDVTEQVLARTQLQQLNAALETRVAERTRDLEQARAEAEGQRARLATVLQQVPAYVNTYRGPDHVFELVHPLTRQLVGNRPLEGLPRRQALPEVAEALHAPFDQVYRTGQPLHQSEVAVVNGSDGTRQERHYDAAYLPLFDATGRVEGVLSFALDVTEKVQARQQRHVLEQQLHDLLLQAPMPTVVLDGPELVFQFVNPAYQAIFPDRTLRNLPLLVALPELAGTPVPTLLAEVYATGETYLAREMPLLLPRPDGGPPEESYWTFIYQARRNPAGTSDGILALGLDVSAQVHARRAVEEREAYFREMADHTPAMLWVNDAEGQCTYLNQRWYEFTGQAPTEAFGLGWTRAVYPADAEAALETYRLANARRQAYHYYYRLRRYDGVYRWVADTGQPRFNAAGDYQGMVGTVVDVHERRLGELALQRLTTKLSAARDEAQRLNAELRQSNEQLTRTNVDLDNFIYTASHDLKAPITNIEGLLDALRQHLPQAGPDDALVAKLLSMMQDSVERFQLTIEQLTDLTRLQHSQDLPAEDIDLAALIEGVCLDLAPLLTATQARVEVAVAECPVVRFAPKNLRSIVYNLLSNALKYRHPDRPPVVRLRCTCPEASLVTLEVQDNGLGLDEAQQARLFGMFQRLHTHVEGSGIGLFMVKRIVENAGGRIGVESTLDQGSTFRVQFSR